MELATPLIFVILALFYFPLVCGRHAGASQHCCHYGAQFVSWLDRGGMGDRLNLVNF